MKKKIFTLLCSGLLSLTVLSSVAVAASASVTSCGHNWVIEEVDVIPMVVESGHQCLVCGARYNLYQNAVVRDHVCTICHKRERLPHEPSGPIYSYHDSNCQAVARLLMDYNE